MRVKRTPMMQELGQGMCNKCVLQRDQYSGQWQVCLPVLVVHSAFIVSATGVRSSTTTGSFHVVHHGGHLRKKSV